MRLGDPILLRYRCSVCLEMQHVYWKLAQLRGFKCEACNPNPLVLEFRRFLESRN